MHYQAHVLGGADTPCSSNSPAHVGLTLVQCQPWTFTARCRPPRAAGRQKQDTHELAQQPGGSGLVASRHSVQMPPDPSRAQRGCAGRASARLCSSGRHPGPLQAQLARRIFEPSVMRCSELVQTRPPFASAIEVCASCAPPLPVSRAMCSCRGLTPPGRDIGAAPCRRCPTGTRRPVSIRMAAPRHSRRPGSSSTRRSTPARWLRSAGRQARRRRATGMGPAGAAVAAQLRQRSRGSSRTRARRP